MVNAMDNYLTSMEPRRQHRRPGWRRVSYVSCVVAALALGAAGLACGGDDADDLASATGAGVARLHVTAREDPVASTGDRYEFDMPDQVPAGAARLSVANEGDEEHHAQLFRLNDGATVKELSGALATGGPAAAATFGAFVGGTGLVAPGSESRADAVVELTRGTYVLLCLAAGAPPPGTAVGGMKALLPGAAQQLQLDLEPGEYAVICHVPSPDGTPHHVRGMVRQVTVG
jgi:hypothetical protein